MGINSKIRRSAIALIGLALAIHAVAQVRASAVEEGKGMGSQEAARHACYFELTKPQLRKFIGSTRKIRLGDSRQTVKTTLGEAWIDLPISPKAPAKDSVGRLVTYYAQKCSKDLANNDDKSITFVFDKNDRLIKIDSNVVGIESNP